MTEIMVNGEISHVMPKDGFLSYDDVALLAGAPGDQGLTITYSRPPLNNHGVSGTLRPGHSIDIEPKMVFDAVRTNVA